MPYIPPFIDTPNKNQEQFDVVQELALGLPEFLKQNLSDGYHTFEELYLFRKIYNAVLFNEWAKPYMDRLNAIEKGLISHADMVLPKYDLHKSWKHNDGELCFGGGWFIVVAILPSGQISNHYEAKDWDLFKVPIVEKAKYEFDGHTSADVIVRLKSLIVGA